MLEANCASRKKLAVSVLSMAEGGAGNEKEAVSPEDKSVSTSISDVTVFKSIHEMYPLVQPYINITRKGNRCKL